MFVAATAVGVWLAKDYFRPDGINQTSVEGVLIAAGIDLDKQRDIVVKDNIERWKIELGSTVEKEQIMKGLRMTVEARGGKWVVGEEIRRKNDVIHLIDISLTDQDAKTLRLLFRVPNQTRKKSDKKPAQNTRPKPEPVAQKSQPPKDYEDLKPMDPVPPTTIDMGQPTIAIILDDIGQREPEILEPVLKLKYPITFAVLPFLPYTSQNAHYLHRNHYEVMLHMPMEPDNAKTNPGKGAIYTHFSADQARDAVDRAMDNVPFIKGVNNHMGSKVTANRSVMSPILEQVKKRSLYFIDSRTKSNTVAFAMAQKMAMPSAKRDVFLDSEMTYDFVVRQLEQTRKVADANGIAIAIGHPYPSTLQALADELPKLNQSGYRFVFASDIIAALHGNL